MHIRPLAPDETDLHRAVRLRALRDSPGSFGETAAAAAARTPERWAELTAALTGPGGDTLLLACEGERVWGCVYGMRSREAPGAGRVGGMWVDPRQRGQGVGRALLAGVIGWAQGARLARLGLWAPAHEPAALALYRRAGFRETGARGVIPHDPDLGIIAMERDL